MAGTEHKKKGRHKASVVGLFMLLIACFGLLGIVPDLRPAMPEVLGLTALATLVLVILFHGGLKGWTRLSPVTILIVAAGLRLLFLFHSPQLSDDIYRYLFDGSRTLAGQNPYALSPEQVAKDNRPMAQLATGVNHPHLITLYPPGAQVIFSVGALWKNFIGMKALLIVLDLLCIALMMWLMSKMGHQPGQVIIYAWHPLAVLEIASSGHIDGVAVMFVFSAICLLWPRSATDREASPSSAEPSAGGQAPVVNAVDLQPGDEHMKPGDEHMKPGDEHMKPRDGHMKPRDGHMKSGDVPLTTHPKGRGVVFFSGFLFSFAILVKLLPIVFLPLCWTLVQRGRRVDFTGGLAVGSLLLILPFCPEIRNALSTLGIYTASWEFSGLAFRFLRDWLNSGIWARIILGIMFTVSWFLCHHQMVRTKKQGAPLSSHNLFGDSLKAMYTVAFVFLLVTPTLHPWYGLYMLGFLPFFPNSSGMILSWTILLGYRVLIPYSILNQWVEGGNAAFLIWVGPMTALLISTLLRYAYRKRAIVSYRRMLP